MRRRVALSAVLALIVSACSSDIPTQAPSMSATRSVSSVTDGGGDLVALAASVNATLAAQGANYQLDRAEWIGEAEIGKDVFFVDRGNKRLGADFVPGDPRRDGRTNISYIISRFLMTPDGLTRAQTSAAIDRAMATWNDQKCSSGLEITREPDQPGLVGVSIGAPTWYADITHAGWLPAGFLPANVIGVTFTFIWIDANGQPTDIDNNGDIDVAFREIYYNDAFTWRINGNIDVESIALHESGHGLSQAHFGELFETTSNGKFHFAPRAVMNAAYTGIQQELAGSDNAGHCSNWGSWPNN
jgi:hypothetical protein